MLYVTPERIVKAEKTRNLLFDLYQNEFLARFVIDEAHCVSTWGHDFRKDYGALAILKEQFPEAPIVALTATARKKVADDTIEILRIPHCRKFHSGNLIFRFNDKCIFYQNISFKIGFDRPNLYFEVLKKPTKISMKFLYFVDIF